jgi:type VI secretion system Hcp family effector
MASDAGGAGNIFIDFEGAKGESRQKGFPGQIEISSFTWDVTADSSWTKGGGASVGKAIPNIATFKHYYDTSSPTLMAFCVKGKHFPKVKVTVLKSTGGPIPTPYFIILMESAFITKATINVEDTGAVSQDIEFVFKKIEVKYHAQDDKGKIDSTAKTFMWDIPAQNATSG